MPFKMSAADKDRVIKALSIPHGDVQLRCDGYRVTLSVEYSKSLTYRVMTYVNFAFKGVWISHDSTAPERKFLRPVKSALYSPKELKRIESEYGKRKLKEFIAKHQKFFIYAAPDWASGRAAINHLCKVCDSIEILDVGHD